MLERLDYARSIICWRWRFGIAIGVLALHATARADYPIGQTSVPEAVVHDDPARFAVYPRHPRLFFRDTDLHEILARIEGEFRQQWLQMAEGLDRLLKQDPAKYVRNPYLKSWTQGRNMAFAALVSGEEKYRRWALQWADQMAAADPRRDTTDDDYRGRLMSLAVAYDWLFPWLSDAQKTSYRQAIVAHVARNWSFGERPNFISGHTRWGNFSLAAGLLAVVTEMPELNDKLLRVRQNWIHGYDPVQGWIAADGGYHMAWTYTGPYTDARIHCIWSSATNECVYYPWREKLPYFFLYGDRGDGTYANSGDAYDWRNNLNERRDTLLVAAGVFKNRHAAGMIQTSAERFYDLLYGDPTVAPLAPDDASQPLPLARHFRHAGVVVMRDRWDDRTTHLAFKSSSFYSANHHHRDENAFTLSYRGALAIDSGYYDRYGSPHWCNYFTRTVAHNAITVFDPQQQMVAQGKPAANDGGQVFREEPLRMEDIQPGGHAALDGILRYEHCDSFTYALGDATKAYDPARVKLAQRELVHLSATGRPHPVIVLLDRVESARPEHEKRFLLHTANKPVLEGNVCVAENGGGRLTCVTLLPARAKSSVVGGTGMEFAVNGVNYPPERLSNTWREIAGSWRLEVVPQEKHQFDCFLHVLLVDDVESSQADRKTVSLIEGDGCIGAQAADWIVIFPRDDARASRMAYKADSQARNHLVTGCRPHDSVTYCVSGGTKATCKAGEGGCALIQQLSSQAGQVQVVVERSPAGRIDDRSAKP